MQAEWLWSGRSWNQMIFIKKVYIFPWPCCDALRELMCWPMNNSLLRWRIPLVLIIYKSGSHYTGTASLVKNFSYRWDKTSDLLSGVNQMILYYTVIITTLLHSNCSTCKCVNADNKRIGSVSHHSLCIITRVVSCLSCKKCNQLYIGELEETGWSVCQVPSYHQN